MRSKSRFTTLVLFEARESYLEIRVQSLCTLRGHSRPGHATFATKRALPLTRTGLPPAGSHQLAWRTHSITSSARASNMAGPSGASALAVLEIEDHLHFRGLVHGQVGGLLALEDT